MGIFQRLLCLLWPKYKKRQQAIAWLTLEGWEPKIMYRAKDYEYPSLVRENRYLQGDGLDTQDTRSAGYPFIAAAWDIFPTDRIKHLVVAVEWANQKGNK